jgi:O-antigen/teichoic acid export membrane protein
MPSAKATFNSVLWNHAGKVLEYVLTYATSIAIARALGVGENGAFVGLISVSQLLFVLSSFGLETSLNKHIPQLGVTSHLEQTRFILRRLLLLRGVVFSAIAGILLIAPHLFSRALLGNAEAYLWILLFYACIRSFAPLFAAVLTAQFNTSLTAKINVATRTLELAGVAAMGFAGMTITRLLTFLIATSLFHVIAFGFFARRNVFGITQGVPVRPIIVFGGIFWVNTFADFFLGRQGDVLFLTNILHESTQASLYDVAYSVNQMALLGATVGLGGITLAAFARLATTSQETMDRFYNVLVKVISFLTIPLYTFLLFNAGSLMPMLYSSRYNGAISLLQGMAAFRIVCRLFAGGENAEYLLSLGRIGVLVGVGICGAMTNVLLNILLIPHMQASGALIASGCANLEVNMLGAALVCRSSTAKIHIMFWLRVSAICCFSGWVSGFVLMESAVSTLVLQICVFSSLLFALFFLVKPFSESDLYGFSKVDHRLKSFVSMFARRRGAAYSL